MFHQEEEPAKVPDATEIVVSARRLLHELDEGSTLRSLGAAMARAAFSVGCTSILGASAPAERLVGAALLEDLRMRGWRGGVEPVALFDVTLASGASLATAARRVRALGAKWVIAVVVQDLVGMTQGAVPGVDRILVLNHNERSLDAPESTADLAATGLQLVPG